MRPLALATLALLLPACGGVGNVDEKAKAWETDRIEGYGVSVTTSHCERVLSAGESEGASDRTYECVFRYSNGTRAVTLVYFSGGGINGGEQTGGDYVDAWAPHSAARDEAAECLSAHGAQDVSTSSRGLDIIDRVATEASGGNLSARFDSTPVTIAFVKSDADAARLEREWTMVLDAIPRAEGTIERHGRAVAHWWGEPPPKARATVAACLASA